MAPTVKERIATKTYRARFELKQVETEGPDGTPIATFDATVAVAGNVDYQNDILESGAFDASLKAWVDSGDPIPVIWSHQWDDPFAHIGYADPKNVRMVGNELQVKGGVLDLTTPLAVQVRNLMKGRRVKEFSFGYDATDFDTEEDEERTVIPGMPIRRLNEVDLFEFGPTLKGANPLTHLDDVKGRRSRKERPEGDEDEGDAGTSPDPGTPVSDEPDASGGGDDDANEADAEAKAEGKPTMEPEQVMGMLRDALEAAGVDGDTAQAVIDAMQDAITELGDESASSDPAAKSRGVKRGRVLSAKNESKLRDAAKLIDEVLSSVEQSDDTDKATPKTTDARTGKEPRPGRTMTLKSKLALLDAEGPTT